MIRIKITFYIKKKNECSGRDRDAYSQKGIEENSPRTL